MLGGTGGTSRTERQHGMQAPRGGTSTFRFRNVRDEAH